MLSSRACMTFGGWRIRINYIKYIRDLCVNASSFVRFAMLTQRIVREQQKLPHCADGCSVGRKMVVIQQYRTEPCNTEGIHDIATTAQQRTTTTTIAGNVRRVHKQHNATFNTCITVSCAGRALRWAVADAVCHTTIIIATECAQ